MREGRAQRVSSPKLLGCVGGGYLFIFFNTTQPLHREEPGQVCRRLNEWSVSI